MRNGFPYARRGQVIGLLGGSFDPAHDGHVQLTETALRRLPLDRIWWVVSPGNPLKAQGPAGMAARIGHAHRLMDHPRVEITDIEARLGTRYTAETLRALRRLYPGVTFVWLMGADNMVQLSRWRDWKEIVTTTPMAIFARPGTRIAARTAKAATVFRRGRLRAEQAARLPRRKPPAWVFLNMPMMPVSSSAIRAAGGWQQSGAEAAKK